MEHEHKWVGDDLHIRNYIRLPSMVEVELCSICYILRVAPKHAKTLIQEFSSSA